MKKKKKNGINFKFRQNMVNNTQTKNWSNLAWTYIYRLDVWQPEPIYMRVALVVFLNRVFLQERFNRFLQRLTPLIKNGGLYFLKVQKRSRYRHIFKTAFLQKNVKRTLNPTTDFSLPSEKKPQSFLVLICTSLKSIVTIQLAAQKADQI